MSFTASSARTALELKPRAGLVGHSGIPYRRLNTECPLLTAVLRKRERLATVALGATDVGLRKDCLKQRASLQIFSSFNKCEGSGDGDGSGDAGDIIFSW